MDTLYTFWDSIAHYKTKSVHFWGLMNSATKVFPGGILCLGFGLNQDKLPGCLLAPLYVYIHVYTYMYIYIHTHTYLSTHLLTFMCLIHANVYVYVFESLCILYTRTYTSAHNNSRRKVQNNLTCDRGPKSSPWHREREKERARERERS